MMFLLACANGGLQTTPKESDWASQDSLDSNEVIDDSAPESDPSDEEPRAPQAGELVISELMINPTSGDDEQQEWLELHSVANVELDLEGLFLLGEDGTGITLHGLSVRPNGYVLLSASEAVADTTGKTPDFVYDNSLFRLGNGDGLASLQQEGVDLDSVAYDQASWPLQDGRSLMRIAVEMAFESDPGQWCASGDALSGGDFGTPGAENGGCEEVVVDLDGDGDGWLAEEGDCDDGDNDVYPGALEILDGVDQDCDGMVDELPPAPGELVIAEIMKNPDPTEDDFGEWFELVSRVGHPLDLTGVVVSDDRGQSFALDAVLLEAGAVLLVGASDDISINGGYTPDMVWAGHDFNLGNDDDEVIMSLGGDVIDEVWYDNGFPDDSGRSLSLDPGFLDAGDNDDADNWCKGSGEYGTDGNQGTPGTLNPGC